MNWHEITVPRSDLGLALGAIDLGGGTVTATKPCGSDVAITYVTCDDRAGSATPPTVGR